MLKHLTVAIQSIVDRATQSMGREIAHSVRFTPVRKEVIGFQMDKISYAQTHDINGHIDYKTKAAGGPLFQLLFRLPGNPLSIYRPAEASGKIDLGDMRLHHIRMELQDANGNKSALLANIIFHGSHQADSPTAPGEIFYPHQLNAVEKEACAFYVGENGMYDSAHIPYASVQSTTPGSVSQVHQIGATGIPLRDGILIRIRPNQDLGPGKMQKVLMQRIAGANQEVRKVEWLGGWAAARFDEFGSFQLLIDEEAPRISPIGFKDGANLKKAQRIQIAVKDNHHLVRAFRAELDGHWLRFSNDKEKAFVYTFDAHCPAGKHRLRVSAEDEAGNTAVKTFTFSR